MAVPTPALPASGVAQQNTSGQDVSVNLTGGTVTAVVVTDQFGNNTTVASSTPANYQIPQGGSHTITYSVAPTQTWSDPLVVNPAGYATENTGPVSQTTDLPGPPAHPEGGEPGLGWGVEN